MNGPLHCGSEALDIRSPLRLDCDHQILQSKAALSVGRTRPRRRPITGLGGGFQTGDMHLPVIGCLADQRQDRLVREARRDYGDESLVHALREGKSSAVDIVREYGDVRVAAPVPGVRIQVGVRLPELSGIDEQPETAGEVHRGCARNPSHGLDEYVTLKPAKRVTQTLDKATGGTSRVGIKLGQCTGRDGAKVGTGVHAGTPTVCKRWPLRRHPTGPGGR
jgi:hypothetical protein